MSNIKHIFMLLRGVMMAAVYGKGREKRGTFGDRLFAGILFVKQNKELEFDFFYNWKETSKGNGVNT